MGQAEAPAAHLDNGVARQAVDAGLLVVVAAHRDDRRDGAELLQHHGVGEVAGVQDHVHPVEDLSHLGRQDGEVLAHVRVGHHADPRRAVAPLGQNPMAWKPA